VTFVAILATLAAAGAAVGLWAGARRHEATVARGYRWLAGAALFWCAGLILEVVMAGSLGSSGAPGLADVAPLLALGTAAVGIMTLAAPSRAEFPAPGGPSPPGAEGGAASNDGGADAVGQRDSILPGSVLPGLADGYVTAVSLLVIGWVVAFGAEYHSSGERPGTFLLDLMHPLLDLAVLGALLPVLTVAWHRVLLPYLSLLALAGADSLGVGARVSGGHQGILQQLAMLAAACLLGASPWVKTVAVRFLRIPWRSADPLDQPALGAAAGTGASTGVGAATVIAAITAASAALVVIIDGLAKAPASGLALVIAGGAAVLVVAVRVLMLVRENGFAVRMWRHSGTSLRDLAHRTSDMVLICDFDGTIAYASPGGTGFTYPPEELIGRRLAEFVHPEDIPAARFVARKTLGLPEDLDPVGLASTGAAQLGEPPAAELAEAAAGTDAAGGRLACRVRAADGTWRHVECAVLLYQVPGEPPRMLMAARDVSDEVSLRKQVAHLTFHDGLTGLPNRAYLEDRVRQAVAEAALVEEAGEAVAPATTASAVLAASAVRDAAIGVMFLDLDGFTGVNDSAGHGAGDVVLAQAARRLRATVPAGDTVARWGGDEFAVLVERTATPREITDLAQRLAEAIAGAPFTVADRDIGLTASVGVAVAEPGKQSADLLLRNADMAMSRAKVVGGNRAEVYAEHMHADVLRRMELATDLKRAIERDELRLQYQPVVELATSRVIGAEALVRWRRDEEDVAPREFLAVAEASGLSVPLGEWVLRTACEQGARWREAGWDIFTAVNLSLRQLTAPQFTADLAAALNDSGLPAAALALEVSERVLVEGAERASGQLAEVRDLGVRLAIDDFGYASLATLRVLAPDIIKIDPSFIAGLGHDPTLTLLTQTIARVGRDLGIEVVAEGIEQPGQLTELTEMGCSYGQGFLLARPMAAAGVEAMLRETTGSRPRVSKAGAA